MSNYSNIMIIPEEFDYFKQFMTRLALAFGKDLNIPLYNSENKEEGLIKTKQGDFTVVSMETGFYPTRTIGDIKTTDTKFFLEVNVMEVLPQSIEESILVFNSGSLER
jgi:hypothetical protein